VNLLDLLLTKSLEGSQPVGEGTHWAGRPS